MAVQPMRPYAVRALRRGAIHGGSGRSCAAFSCGILAAVRRAWFHVKDVTYLDMLEDGGWASLGEQESLAVLIAASNIGAERKPVVLGG